MDTDATWFKDCKAILLVLLVALYAQFSRAQELWTDANLKYPLNQKWTLSCGLQYRTTDKLKVSKRMAANMGVTYKPLKFMTVDADYEFQRRRIGSKETPAVIIPAFWNTFNRVHVSVSLSWRFQSIILSLRERYAITHRSGISIPIQDHDGLSKAQHHISPNTGQVLRTRGQLRWDTPNFPVDPFFNAEIFEDIASNCYIDRIRYTFGLNIKVKGHSTIKPYYRYIDNLDGTSDSSVIGLSYEYSF